MNDWHEPPHPSPGTYQTLVDDFSSYLDFSQLPYDAHDALMDSTFCLDAPPLDADQDALFRELHKQQQQQHPLDLHKYQHVPPTPTSMDLLYHAPQFRDELFTPLLSPAVAPLAYNYAPAAAFSPLTSPALAAHAYSHIPPPSPALAPRKGPGARRTSAASRNPARVVRASPSMKPVRKRPPPPLASPPPPQLTPASSNASVSPEPLPARLMPPPQRQTPASLMRLPPSAVRADDIPPVGMDTSEFLHCDVQRAPAPPPAPPRKRGSVASSPALAPRISPLLAPNVHSDSHAFLLASKSNYQNIVEGNTAQLGLSYPEHLSTNLTSKRTSHKIAEQGRRNRINNALAEMAGLLPPVVADDAKDSTSKASTVELALLPFAPHTRAHNLASIALYFPRDQPDASDAA